MKEQVLLLFMTFTFVTSAMESEVKKHKMTDSCEDMFDVDVTLQAGQEKGASGLLELCQMLPNEIQMILASYLYKSSNIEAFLKRKGENVPCSEMRVNVGYMPTFNRAADKILVTDLYGVVTLVSLEHGTCIQTFEGHEGLIASGVFSKEEDKILTTSRDGSAKIWSVESGDCLQTFRVEGSLFKNAVFDDENEDRILTAFSDCTLRTWSIESGECLQCSVIPHFLASLCNGNSDVVVTYVDCTVKLWLVENSECLQTFNGHDSVVNEALLNKSADKLFTASYDGTAKVWSIESGECLQTFDHGAPVVNIVVNGTENEMMTMSTDLSQEKQLSFTKLWSLKSGRCLQTVFHGNKSSTITFNQAGDAITVSYDGMIKVWDIHFWERFTCSLTLKQVYLLAEIREIAKHKLWLKLKEKKGDTVRTHDGKRVTKDQLVIDFITERYKDLKEGYEALPPFIQDTCKDSIRNLCTISLTRS